MEEEIANIEEEKKEVDSKIAEMMVKEKKRMKKQILKQMNADGPSEALQKYKVTSNVKFSDLGGINHVIEQLRQMIEWPLSYKDIFAYLGVSPPRGILICGPPGTGKTQLAMAIAGEFAQIPFFKLSAPEIVSGLSGQSEEKIRKLFHEVSEQAPAIIFIDELDSIAGKRENAGKDMEVRIVA